MKKALVFALPVFALIFNVHLVHADDTIILNCRVIETSYDNSHVGDETVYTINFTSGSVQSNGQTWTLKGVKKMNNGSLLVRKIDEMSTDKIEFATYVNDNPVEPVIIDRHTGILKRDGAMETATCRKVESQGF